MTLHTSIAPSRAIASATDSDFRDWVERARAGSFERAIQLCGFTPAKGSNKGKDRAGPCPDCGGRDRFSVHFQKRKFNCRGCGVKGIDALALALVGGHVSFVEACEDLSGEPRPARVEAETAEEKAARAARRRESDQRRAEEARKREAESEKYRARERAACHRIWEMGRDPTSVCLDRYFEARRLLLPASALIREADEVAFYHGEELDARGFSHPRLIHRGPAMLAQMLDNDGAFTGLHITYLRRDWGGKVEIFDLDTGEALPAKKMRGSKKGAHIVLRQPDTAIIAAGRSRGAPIRLFMGEGIETVASVATALKRAGRLDPLDHFWATGDLGNLGGPAAGTMAHPVLKSAKGRAQRLPGPVPDFSAPGILIPAHVTQLVLLGDGDSEAVLTKTTLERARRRYAVDRERSRYADPAIPPLAIGVAMAPAGSDFNDLLQVEE